MVQAPTGSGKSTRLPLWCATQGRVLVVQPRRIACRALALHLARSEGGETGGRIGYAVRFDSRFNPDTEILFVTPGIALAWLAEGVIKSFDTVILDEFHERRWDTDLLAAILRKQRENRLIIASATLNGDPLARYIGGQLLTAEGRLYPVEIGYTGDEGSPSSRDLVQRVVREIERCLKQSQSGDLLVFLPGKGEIQAALKQLAGLKEADPIPLHAGVDLRIQDRALNLDQRRRIILATNVAETSLTIPGVGTVIDSGLERRTHHRNGRTVLGLHPISRAAADQRAGRAGRLGPGRCVRLWGRRAPLEDHTPPQILREELTELFIAAAAAGTPANRLEFPDPLPVHAVERAQNRLERMSAIDREGLLTAHGRRLAPLPLDPLFAHLISRMPDQESRSAMVDLAAALSAGRSLLRPASGPEEAQALKRWNPLECDATSLIKLIRQQPPGDLPCDREPLGEARRIAKEVRSALQLPPIGSDRSLLRDTLLRSVIESTPELLFIRRERRREALGNGYCELLVGRESSFPKAADAALVFDQHSLPGKGTRQTHSYATCMAPVRLQLLAELEVGETVFGSPEWRDGELRVECRREYAGRTIAREIQSPSGALARAALATLLLNNQVMAGTGLRLVEEIEAWNLYLNLGMGQGEAVDPEHWLRERLERLGVEQAEDMQLLGTEDLRFQGVPEWERERFDTRYPRSLQLENMQVKVSYDPHRKRVTLVRHSGIRRTQPRPIELPAWPGWRVYFRDASRVVAIR